MSAYLDLILLLIIVCLIFYRLRQILGTRPNDSEIKIVMPREFLKACQKLADEKEGCQVVNMEDDLQLSPMERTLRRIPNFSVDDFYRRCERVFEMVLKAFASDDEATLKMLLGKKLFTAFQNVIKQRQQEGMQAETDLIRIENMKIEKADISAKGVAKIVVRFVSEQINILKNSAGEVIEGDENFVQKVTDVWTFERNLNTESPAWFLVSTKKDKA